MEAMAMSIKYSGWKGGAAFAVAREAPSPGCYVTMVRTGGREVRRMRSASGCRCISRVNISYVTAVT